MKGKVSVHNRLTHMEILKGIYSWRTKIIPDGNLDVQNGIKRNKIINIWVNRIKYG